MQVWRRSLGPARAVGTAVRRAPVWGWRWARWWSPVVASVGLTLILVVLTARLTLLDAHYDQRAVARSNAFERLYSEVLPEPAAQAALRHVLHPLPVDPSFVTANTRLLLPPDVLQDVVNEVVAQFVRYLLGDIDRIDTTRMIQPAVAHVEAVSQRLLPGAVTTRPALTTESLSDFDQAFVRFITSLRTGHVPTATPVLPLSSATAADVAATLTEGLDAGDRAVLDQQVRALLDAGRLADALAVVAPAYAAQNPELAQRITHRVSTTIRTVRDPLGELRHNGTVRSLRTLHRALPSGLWSLILLGAGLLTLAVGFALRAGRADGRSPTAVTAVTVGGAAAFAAVAGLLILFSSPDPLRTLVGSGSLPPALAEIVADIDDGLRGGVVGTYLRLLAVVVFLALALAAPHLFRRLRSVTRRPPTRVLAAGSALAVAAALTATTLPSPPRVTTCNGYAALCVVPYDSVTYLAAHNAMAASDAGFVDAEQDPTIIGQLDNGVRALLIDFHYWTAPEQVTRYVDSLSPRTRALIAPFLTTLESRPGVWLCHIVCQLGASPAVGTLRAVGEWLAAHRDAVLTLIIEDHTSLADTEATIEDAGLRRYVQPPPAPDTAWPTLGQMVRSGHRLVVFTERQDDPQGWLRNYHLIGAETPFRAASPAQLTCAPGRGPAKAPLFLLNNWISSSAPSRTDAATVNSPRFLLRRARQCARERGMTPTYIAVDFAEIGNPLRAVAMLNRVSPGS